MKKLIFLFLLLPFFATAQVQTDAAIITQINNTIRNSTFNNKNTANAFKTIVDSKVSLSDAETITGQKTFLDGTVKLRNVANTFDGIFSNTNTGNRTYTLNDFTGTLLSTGGITTISSPSNVILKNSVNTNAAEIIMRNNLDNNISMGILGSNLNNSSYSLVTGNAFILNSSGNFHIRTLGGLSFGTGSSATEKMFLDSNGALSIGGTITNSSTLLDLQSTTKALILPRVTNTASVTTPVNGMKIYDVALNKERTYENGAWVNTIGGGGGIGGSTGATDNSLLRADGTGGSTLQNSAIVIDDTGNVALGLSGTAGASRTIQAIGSASDLSLILAGKGSSYTASLTNDFTSYLNLAPNSIWNTSNSEFVIIGGAASGSSAAGSVRINGGQAANGVGGHVRIVPGGFSGAGTIGNIQMGGVSLALSAFQGMQNGIYVNNRVAAPSAGIANGVAIIAEDLAGSSELYTVSESGAKFNVSGLITNVILSGTTLTLTEAHRGAFIYCTNSSAVTITVPSNLQLGFNCTILQDHATGTVSLTGSGGATINGKTSTTGLYDKIGINYYKATNVYIGL